MADAIAAPTEASTTPPPTDAPKPDAPKEAAPPKPDPRAELNEAVKKAGLKLKAKDREIPVTSVDDLVSRANRVFGVESMLEEAKAAKSEAEQVKAWKAAIEDDDAERAASAFEDLSPKAKRNAMVWLDKQMRAAQEEEQLSPREKEYRKALEESERQRKDYERREMERQQKEAETQHRAELEKVKNQAAGIAVKVLEALKAQKELAPALIPRVARYLRVGLEAGVELSPEEVSASVKDDLMSEHRMLVDGMTGDALLDHFGPEVSKRMMKAALARRHQTPPTQAQAVAAGQEQKPKPPTEDALRGTPRFFR